jgi:hypothetical protein
VQNIIAVPEEGIVAAAVFCFVGGDGMIEA